MVFRPYINFESVFLFLIAAPTSTPYVESTSCIEPHSSSITPTSARVEATRARCLIAKAENNQKKQNGLDLDIL